MHNQKLPQRPTNEPSRALVPVDAPVRTDADATSKDQLLRDKPFRDHCVGPLAGFVTQLIACRRRLPEYRTRRLAEPGAATQLYDAVEHRPVASRRLFERLY